MGLITLPPSGQATLAELRAAELALRQRALAAQPDQYTIDVLADLLVRLPASWHHYLAHDPWTADVLAYGHIRDALLAAERRARRRERRQSRN